MAIASEPQGNLWQRFINWLAPPHVREQANALKEAKQPKEKEAATVIVPPSPIREVKPAVSKMSSNAQNAVMKLESPHQKLLNDFEARLHVHVGRLGWSPARLEAYVAHYGMVVTRLTGPEGQQVCRINYNMLCWVQKTQTPEDRIFVREFKYWEEREQVIAELFTASNLHLHAPVVHQTWDYKIA